MRTKLVCNRSFPDPPGILTEQNGERKHGHCARTDSSGTPPRPVSAACRRTYYIFPLPYSLKLPGIVTEQNGERKHGHCARTDSSGTPPRPVSAACPPNLFHIPSSLFPKLARYRWLVHNMHITKSPGEAFFPWGVSYGCFPAYGKRHPVSCRVPYLLFTPVSDSTAPEIPRLLPGKPVR